MSVVKVETGEIESHARDMSLWQREDASPGVGDLHWSSLSEACKGPVTTCVGITNSTNETTYPIQLPPCLQVVASPIRLRILLPPIRPATGLSSSYDRDRGLLVPRAHPHPGAFLFVGSASSAFQSLPLSLSANRWKKSHFDR